MAYLYFTIFLVILLFTYLFGVQVGWNKGEEFSIRVTKHWVQSVLSKHIVLADTMDSKELMDSICRDFGFEKTEEYNNE